MKAKVLSALGGENLKKLIKIIGRENIKGYTFILPFIIGTILFFAFPIIRSLMISFAKITEVSTFTLEFVGFKNYKDLFFTDTQFIPYFLNSAKEILINSPLIIIFSMGIGILVNGKIAGRGFFRSVYFLPVVLGSGFIMQQLMKVNINQQAMQTAIEVLLPQNIQIYLGANGNQFVVEFLSRVSLVLWSSGVQIVIYLAALQGVSKSLYEAAKVDGASEWEMFWKITLPMTVPIISLIAVFTIISLSVDFNTPIVNYINWLSFKGSIIKFEYASSVSWFYSLFVGILIVIVTIVLRPFNNNVKDI